MKRILTTFLLFTIALSVTGQGDRIAQISSQLEVLIIDQPGLDESIETSVSQVSITEFIRSLGISHELNISVSEGLNEKLVNNFSNARVADVLVFLCEEYQLDLQVFGGIISIKKYQSPEVVELEEIRLPVILYDAEKSLLSLDLRNDSLKTVVRELTRITGKNVIAEPGLEAELLNVYIQNRPFAEALEKAGFANGLDLIQDGEFAVFSKKGASDNSSSSSSSKTDRTIPEVGAIDDLAITVKDDKVTVISRDADMALIIDDVATKLGYNYFIYSLPQESVSLYLEEASFEELLTFLFHGTEFAFIKQEDVYMIGTRANGMVTTELIQLKHRTIDNILATNALRTNSGTRNSGTLNQGGASNQNARASSNRGSSSLQSELFGQEIDIQPFPELNGFIVTGSYPEVKRFKDFIFQIDQVVPVVMIEVLIVDVNKNRLLSAGLNAGLGENAGETTGEIIGPSGNQGLNLDLSTESINDIVGSLNGTGLVNLGNVSPNFYLSIQAMETDGLLRTRSTPKLATLNSYPATLSIGRQEYYLELRTNVNSSAANNVITEQQVWVPLEADLSIEITPVVSGDEQVTLDLFVTQSNFTERSGVNGPFGTVVREFDSSIRVKNGDMILLGGLDEKVVSNSGGGLPLLARIPILRWFFGSRTRSTDDTRLNIFIRPTILY